MTTPFTVPPPSKIVGEGGFVADINNAYNALAVIGGVNVLDSQWAGGADPTGVNDSTAAIQAAIGGLPATGGIVYIPAGAYRVNSTITVTLANNATVMIRGDGYQATFLNFHGTGDCIRMRDPSTYAGNNIAWRSGVTGLTIDGTSAAAGSTGLHVGDIGMLKLDLMVQNFTGTGAIGIWFDNTVSWTEEADVRAVVANCTQHVVFQVTTGFNSFGYGAYDFTVFTSSNQQDGVVIKNGALVYHSSLRIRGNFTAGAAATTAAALRLTGVAPAGTPNAGRVSEIVACHLDVQVECSSGAFAPASVNIDQVNFCVLASCYGILDFGYGAGGFASAQFAATLLQFAGIVNDNGTLAPVGSGPGAPGAWRAINKPAVYATPAATTPTLFQLFFPTAFGDFFTQVLGGNWTVGLNFSGVNAGTTLGVPQRVTIILKQPASGTTTWTVTWPHNVTPTTTSPTVVWAGGTAPVMTTGASATDAYYLETIDGATWYGRAAQNMR